MSDACMHILNVNFEDGPYNEPGVPPSRYGRNDVSYFTDCDFNRNKF